MYQPTKLDRFLLGLARVLEALHWLVAAFAVLALFPTVIQSAFFALFGVDHSSWLIPSIYGWTVTRNINRLTEAQRDAYLLFAIPTVVLVAIAIHCVGDILSYAGPLFKHRTRQISDTSANNTPGTPFTEQNVLNLRHTAEVFILIVVVQGFEGFFLGAFEAEYAFWHHKPKSSMENVFGFTQNNSWLIWLLAAILIFCLARMFEYGVKLQKDNDELI